LGDPDALKILREEGLMLAGTTALERDCGVWIVTLRGEHDLSTASGLRNSLARSFSGGSTVIVDMSQADSIDSTTRHVLIRASRQRHAIAVVAPTRSCARRLADLADAIPTFQTRAEALAHLGAADAGGCRRSSPPTQDYVTIRLLQRSGSSPRCRPLRTPRPAPAGPTDTNAPLSGVARW
jgi:anti-anti-sigma factor